MVLAPLRLLLVDDDEGQHTILDAILARTTLTYRLDRCASGDEALTRVDRDHYDLCFVAQGLEASKGVELIRACVARGVAPPMIMLTRELGPELATEALAAGAADYLQKDRFDADMLERTIRCALERSRMMKEREELLTVVEHERARMARLVERLPVVVWESTYDENGELQPTYKSLFESFMNNSPILNFIKDEEGRYLFVNDAFAKLVKRAVADVIGRTDHEVFPPETAESFCRNDANVREAGRPLVFVERALDDGLLIVSHVVKFPIQAADGATLLGGIAVDISGRVAAEESLRRSEERFLLSARATNDLVYDWDMRTDAIWWNENLTSRFGYSLDVSRYDLEWWKRTIHAEDRDRVLAQLDSAIDRREQTLSMEYRFCRADGSFASTVDRGCIVYDDEGRPMRMIGVVIDVTERVEAEAELRRREEEYRRIVETAQEGIWMVDADDRTTLVNARMAEMFGRTSDEIVGLRPSELVPELNSETMRGRRERRRRGLSEQYEFELTRPDGKKLWTLVSANPIFDLDGQYSGTLAMVTDITDRRRAELALREANDMLEQRVQDRTAALAETMRKLEIANAAQKRFVADASHDLRTPLTVVRAELDLLLRHAPQEASNREPLERALGEIKRLDRLASDLLALATIDNPDPGTVRVDTRLDELLLEAISNLTPIARDRNITWNIDIDDALEIACNREALLRALTNVLENALKYSPHDAAVDVHFRRLNGSARIVVSDRGIGIAAGELPRVYDRFYRSDAARSTPGTGLGLPIAKSIVESHRGTIEIESGTGTGTTVTIVLPLADERTLD